eukprot:TRINITY_DN71_c0_g1_i2.p1 TRINITY_DN71_c0_g1~~TRINITY_DN71_c0_g1_i2.p1  ORF type:complete len:411 (+),score=92.06 TRINITY_DN71_c0_g1_i2:1021-2253(+)
MAMPCGSLSPMTPFPPAMSPMGGPQFATPFFAPPVLPAPPVGPIGPLGSLGPSAVPPMLGPGSGSFSMTPPMGSMGPATALPPEPALSSMGSPWLSPPMPQPSMSMGPAGLPPHLSPQASMNTRLPDRPLMQCGASSSSYEIEVPPDVASGHLRRSRSDEALRSSIAERFAGAYEAQIGHLARTAAEEKDILQTDIGALRNLAYMAQRSAIDQRQRTEQARGALHLSSQESFRLREAIRNAYAELAEQGRLLAQNKARIRTEEAASQELQERFQSEAAELAARCDLARRHRVEKEEQAKQYQRAIEEAHAERLAEAEIASEHRLRMESAEAARKRALEGLERHEDHTMRALREAVATLEGDFAKERANYQERDRRSLARIQELERQLDERRYPGAAATAARLGAPGVPAA